MEEHREVFTQGLPVIAKLESHIPWQPSWWIWRAGNSVLAGESPNLHPVSVIDFPNQILAGGQPPAVVAFVFSKTQDSRQPSPGLAGPAT